MATHVDVVAEAALATDDLPTDLASRLASGLTQLVDAAEKFDAGDRSLVRAALVYFLMTDDVANDLSGPHGLDDDAELFNDVCDRVGQVGLKITL